MGGFLAQHRACPQQVQVREAGKAGPAADVHAAVMQKFEGGGIGGMKDQERLDRGFEFERVLAFCVVVREDKAIAEQSDHHGAVWEISVY